MKKPIWIGLAIIVLIIIIAFFSCSKKDDVYNTSVPIPKGDTSWEYPQVIPEPITGISTASEDVVLGDLTQNMVQISIPKSSFDTDMQVHLVTPKEVPDIVKTQVDTIGSPIEISAGEPVRLNEKATVKFKFDKNTLPPETEKYQLRVVYYNGNNWDYIRPTDVDMEAGIATFETYHFSFLGFNKVKDETVITEQWIHSQALDNKMKGDFNNMSDEVANKIVDMMLGKMGISDKSVKGAILSDLLKDDGYKELYDAYNQGDVVGFSQKVAIMAGSKIASNVPESVMQGALENISGDSAEDVAKVAQAAGYMAEGQYREAAKIIGEQIADKFLITTAGKIAVEVVGHQIESWKNSEIEAAYKAYKNGANNHFYGYNVDAGDFEALYRQMRGLGRQLEIEAIKKENEIRRDAGMPLLTERQSDLIRENVKRSLKNQFEKRSTHEEELKKEEEKIRTMIKTFKEGGFFDYSTQPVDFDGKGYDYETKLSVLNHFMEKMMRDTGRYEFTDKAGLLVTGKIYPDDLLQAARFYFSGPEGKKKYQEFLTKRFGISFAPKLSDLAGAWNGTATITNVTVDEEMKQQFIASLEAEGCDVSESDISENIGKAQPFNFTITPTSETTGNIVSSGSTDIESAPFTYKDGVISASISQEGALATITMVPSGDPGSLKISGSMFINFKEFIKIDVTISAAK